MFGLEGSIETLRPLAHKFPMPRFRLREWPEATDRFRHFAHEIPLEEEKKSNEGVIILKGSPHRKMKREECEDTWNTQIAFFQDWVTLKIEYTRSLQGHAYDNST